MCSAQHHRPTLKLIRLLRSPLELYPKDSWQPLGRNLIGIQYRLDRTPLPYTRGMPSGSEYGNGIHGAGALLAASGKW